MIPNLTSFLTKATLFGVIKIFLAISSSVASNFPPNKALISGLVNSETPNLFVPAINKSSIKPKHVLQHKLYAIITDGYNDWKSNTTTGLDVLAKKIQ